MIIVLKVHSTRLSSGASFVQLISCVHDVSFKIYWQNKQKISQIKWLTPQASLPASTHTGLDPKKLGIQPQRELNPRAENTFIKAFSKQIYIYG